MTTPAERVGGWVWRLARRVAAWFRGREYDSGPSAAHAATSRPGVGFSSAAAIRYSFTEDWSAVSAPVGTALRGRRVALGDELRYAVLPEWADTADVRDGFAADAVALDLVFDDGSRLSDLGPVDQYGVALDPLAQHEGRVLHPDQWNLVRASLDAAVGRVIERVELHVAETRQPGSRRAPLVGWIGETFGARWSIGVGAIASLVVALGALYWTRKHWHYELRYRVKSRPHVQVRYLTPVTTHDSRAAVVGSEADEQARDTATAA